MEQGTKLSLEKALAKAEEDANVSLKAAQAVAAAAKRLHKAARVGDIRELRAAMDGMEKAELALRQQVATAKAGWDFNAEAYLTDGSFTAEVLAIAEQKGLRLYHVDDRLYCYPVLIRVSPGESAILIDKVKERKLRPTVLVNHLKELQKRPPRFRPEAFLEALYETYGIAVKLKGRELFSSGTVIPLLEIYELFTLLPGQSKEYSRHEFARDVYLLDRSGVATTKKGDRVDFSFSSATRLPGSRILTVINELGEVKRYYGISFSPASKE